ncbi:MAG: tetratricopeptide repeat protein [Rhodospirillales bacterium]|nr:tetratricopeptide repeat protein [Rhodospirillales bacterium]
MTEKPPPEPSEPPEALELRMELAVRLHQDGELAKAEDIYREVLEVQPGNTTALHLLGVIALQSGFYEKALALIGESLKLAPHFPEALNNMGIVLAKMGRLEEALLSYQVAIHEKPDYAIAYNHMASALRGLGRLDDAVASYQQAIILNPEFAEAHFDLSHIYLLMGRYEEGWQEYGWRRRVAEFKHSDRPFSQAIWDGSNLDGKTILLYSEQGLGDFLQFVRYLPLMAAGGGRIVLEAPPQMARLLKGFETAHTLVPSGTALPAFDCHASLMDLPAILGTTLETIPAPPQYITADADLTNAWAERLGAWEDFRIGLVWSGNPDNTENAKRSMDSGLLKPLFQIPGVSLYSLQVGRDGEASTIFGDAATDLAPELTDFADTAAVLENLDLVVSVDTAVAHLAGAMGRPVWVPLAFMPDWRWMFERGDCPWYPSMRLFRQSTAGDWGSVLKRLSAAIIKEVMKKRAP